MEKVLLKPIHHRNAECIGIYFKKNDGLQKAIQKEVGAKWSKTKNCWYVPLSEINYKLLAATLLGKAIVDTGELRKYLLEKKKNKSVTKPSEEKKIIAEKKVVLKEIKKISTSNFTHSISKENEQALEDYHRHLILKGYSESTIRTYTNEFTQFLRAIKNNTAADFSVLRLKNYLEYCYTKLHLSENTMHSKINSLKFYYEQVLGKEKFFWKIPRPKKHLILPKVLGEEELRRLFDSVNNLKHKAILFTAYSAGLRVSEVINLRFEDIDRERKQLFVYCSKGKKDRYVALSPLLLDILESYYKMWQPKPTKYVFEGEEIGKPYSIRSAQIIFHNAKEKARISKSISFHGLRHSFATHLLEKGVDVKYIKEILGHFNIKTTERYLHVKRETLVNIVSPLDALYGKE